MSARLKKDCQRQYVSEVRDIVLVNCTYLQKDYVLLHRNKGRDTIYRGSSPLFMLYTFRYRFDLIFYLTIALIDKRTIKQLADEFLEGTSGFVVDVKVASGNVIKIALENDERTSIEDCMALSRHIEGSFDREEEDFALDVGSPGLDQPLKVLRQYKKIISNQIMILPIDGKKTEGELISVQEEEGEVLGLVLKTREKKRIEGRKAKQWVEEEHQFKIGDLEWTKVIISFK